MSTKVCVDTYGEDVARLAELALELMRRNDPSIEGEGGAWSPSMFAQLALGQTRPGGWAREVPEVFREIAEWTFGWVYTGMPRVLFGHRHAASLMTTSLAKEMAESLRSPWKRFALVVPERILHQQKVTVLVREVTVSCENTTTGVTSAPELGLRLLYFQPEVAGRFGGAHSHQRVTASMPELARPEAEDEVDNRHLARSLNLVMRYALSALLELQGQASAIGASGPREPNLRGSGPPTFWNVTPTRPITHDVREAVRAYLRGNGKSLTKQGIVCGHWKNQRCGPGGTERKFIHIEPYWRGPEDAPIAVRSHILKGSKDAGDHPTSTEGAE